MKHVVATFSLAALLCMIGSVSVHAQDKPSKPQKHAVTRKAAPHASHANAASSKHDTATATTTPATPSSRPAAAEKALPPTAAAAPADKPGDKASDKPRATAADSGDADVRKEGDTEVKAMEFTGLDIDGSLKTPQMLYFLNRLRAEFDRPRLPHRSFMPELQRVTKDKPFE